MCSTWSTVNEWPPGWRKQIASTALSETELAILDELARKAGVTRSAMLREILLGHIEDEDPPPPVPEKPYTW